MPIPTGPALLLTLEYPPDVGGVGNYYWKLVQHFPPHRIIVCDNRNNQLLSPWLKTWFVLWRYRKKEQFSSIIVGHVLPLGTVVLLWHIVFGTPYIVYTHGMDMTLPARFLRKRVLLRWILRKAAFVITVSRYTSAKIKLFLPQKSWNKIILIPPGPSISPTTPTESFADPLPEQFMLSAGRLVERKGLDTAIKAFAQVHDEFQNFHYVIAGDGSMRTQLEALIERLGLTSRVRLVGRVSNGQLAQLYERCQFLVLASRILADVDFEGFGMVILEANSFKKPAIGTRAGGIPDAIQHEHTGLLVAPDSVEELAGAIRRLIRDTTLRGQLGQAAQRYVNEHHRWAQKAQTVLALLQRL